MSKKKKAMKTLQKVAARTHERILDSVPWNQRLMLWTTMQMAERGKGILDRVRERVGEEPMSGHVVDVLMNAAAGMERAALGHDPEAYEDALVAVLFLARHLAYQQGKMRPEDVAPHKTPVEACSHCLGEGKEFCDDEACGECAAGDGSQRGCRPCPACHGSVAPD